MSLSDCFTEVQNLRKQSWIERWGSWNGDGTAFILLVGLASLSLISGYRSNPVSFETQWQFSPLGLLTGGLNLDLLDFQNQNSKTWELSLDYFFVFLKTCVLELPFYFYLTRKKRFLQSLTILVLSNALTHPAVFFIFPRFFDTYLWSVLTAEIFAPSIEVWTMLKLNRQAELGNSSLLVIALISLANLFSWQIGMFL